MMSIERYSDIQTPSPPKEEVLDHRTFRSIGKQNERAGCASLLILLATLCFMVPFVFMFIVSAYLLHTEPYILSLYLVGALGTVTGSLTVWAAFQATNSNAKRSVQLTSYARDLEQRQRAQHGSLSISVDEEEMHGAIALHQPESSERGDRNSS